MTFWNKLKLEMRLMFSKQIEFELQIHVLEINFSKKLQLEMRLTFSKQIEFKLEIDLNYNWNHFEKLDINIF